MAHTENTLTIPVGNGRVITIAAPWPILYDEWRIVESVLKAVTSSDLVEDYFDAEKRKHPERYDETGRRIPESELREAG